VLSVVIGGPGVYDEKNRRLTHAFQLPGWVSPAVVQRLRYQLGQETAFENDVDLAALGEQAYGLGADVDAFAYLHIGTGIGLGIVIDGKLHRGAHGAAGELAFLYPVREVGESSSDSYTRGRFETVAAGEAIVASARLAGLVDVREVAEVFSAAEQGNSAALETLAGEVEYLAHALVPIVALLDPELVVFGGGVGANVGILLDQLRARLSDLIPLTLPRLEISTVGNDAVLLGAIAQGSQLARRTAFTNAGQKL
jgi:predicted NBD/HSP70 family sugar kinase